MKVFIAAVIGIISAGIAIWALEFLGHILFPVQLSIDPKDPESIRMIMFSIPKSALIAIIVAHVLGILIGLIVGRFIDHSTRGHLYGISGVMLLLTVVNLVAIPHPTWFLITDIMGVAIVSALYIGTRKKA